MASIKDALEESINERGALLKYIIYAIPLYFAFQAYTGPAKFGSLAITLYAVSGLILLGFMTRCANNVMNYRDNILPTYNFISLIWDSLKATHAIGPWCALNIYIANYLMTNFIPKIAVPWIASSATYITYGICYSIVLTAFMLYAKSQKITDAYNLKIISDSCIDILIQVIWMSLQLALLNAIIIGTVTYLFWLFLGLQNPILIFIWAMTALLNAAITGNYLGQLNYEALHHDAE